METSPERLSTEIAHVLFMDMVGYSLRTMEDQARLSHELRLLVRATLEFQRGEERQELISLDTGDGMALVFFRDPIAPVQCALEISRSLRTHPDVHLRMGIHSGPVARIPDIRGKENVSGGGINIAQRVMDCGDAGHILLSHSSAEVLAQFETWAACLHELGSCEIKHGTRLHLYNLFIEEIGNAAIPARLAAISPPTRENASDAQRNLPQLTSESQQKTADERLSAVGGALPIESNYYIVRATDEAFFQAITRQDSIVLVKGARQMGKTSLLARGLQEARKTEACVVLTDFQTLNTAQLENIDTLFLTLAEMIADQLDLDVSVRDVWSQSRGANLNLERFLRREVLKPENSPLVWGLDEVDRLFGYAYSSEVFGLFRSWHNARALNPSGPWSRLTLAMAYATEAHLFITDLNQSPFNVGTRITLGDFTSGEVAELNRRYNAPLHSEAEVARYMALVGGQPYLVRRGLHTMIESSLDIAGFEKQAVQEDGLFADHLRRMRLAVQQDQELCSALRAVLQGQPCSSADAFFRLQSAGVLVGHSLADARPRCGLYQTYLETHLP